MATEKQTPPADDNRKVRFYYDGDCGLCTRTVNWLRRMDLGRRVAWVAFQSLEEPRQGLTWADFDRAAYLELTDGTLYRGFYAFRKLTLLVPLLLPLAPILWFPGMQFPGKVVYRWVAANRYRLSRCGLPQRRRDSHVQAPTRLKDDF